MNIKNWIDTPVGKTVIALFLPKLVINCEKKWKLEIASSPHFNFMQKTIFGSQERN